MHKIQATPMATPRPRFAKGKHVYQDPAYMRYKEMLAWEIKALNIPKGEYHKLYACFGIPYSKTAKKSKHNPCIESTPHASKPDWDNLVKGLQDALQDAGVIEDDNQIYMGMVTKVWTNSSGYIKFHIE